MSQGSSAAWLCWSSAHLVLCGPDESSWTLTQIWVLARMPDYKLDSKVQCYTRVTKSVYDAAGPSKCGPAEAGDLLAKAWPPKVRGEEGRGRSDPSRSSSAAGLCWSSAHLVQCGPDEPSYTWTQTWVQACMPVVSLVQYRYSTGTSRRVGNSIRERLTLFPPEVVRHWLSHWVYSSGITMLDYSLNWTARSSAIQRWQRCQRCSSPSQSRGHFSLKSAIEHWPSGTDARQSADRAFSLGGNPYLSLPPTRENLTQGQ